MFRYAVLLISIFLLPAFSFAQTLSDTELRNRGMAAFDKLPAYPGVKDAQVYADAVSYLFAYEQRLLRAKKNPDQGFRQAFHWLYAHINEVNPGKGDLVERAIPNKDLKSRGLNAYNKAKHKDSFVNNRVWDIASYIRAQANLFTYIQLAGSGSSQVNAAYAWIRNARPIQSGTKGDEAGRFANWRPSTQRPGSATVQKPLFVSPVVVAQSVNTVAEKDWKKEYDNQVKKYEDLNSRHLQLSQRYARLQQELIRLRDQLKQYQAKLGENTGKEVQGGGKTFRLVLNDAGDSKVQVIKIIRAYSGKGLKASKELTENLPRVVFRGIDAVTARKMASELLAAGAMVNIEEE